MADITVRELRTGLTAGPYIQEVMASTFMTDIDDDSRTKVLKAMDLFLEILSRAIKFHACRIPQPTWVFLFSASK